MGVGNKSKKVLLIERIMSCATILACIVGVCSIFLVKQLPMTGVRIAGIVVGILGVIFFATATISRKTPKENKAMKILFIKKILKKHTMVCVLFGWCAC